jgi:hypothetical protein
MYYICKENRHEKTPPWLNQRGVFPNVDAKEVSVFFLKFQFPAGRGQEGEWMRVREQA